MDPSNVLGFPKNPLVQLQNECAAIQAEKQGLEIHNAELVGQLVKINLDVHKLKEERDDYRRHIRIIYGAVERNRKQHDMELNDKDLEIQTLKSQLADSEEKSNKKVKELEELYAKESIEKSQLIYNLNSRLCLEEQKYDDKIKMLQKEHAKQIEGKSLELQTLKAQQEQHVKTLNDKDLVIQDLATSRSAAEQQTIDKMMELTNEQKKKNEDVHVELGKLYVELQEAKKPQEALMARLDAKNKGIEYLTKQHEEKLAAKDSEIERLTKMVQDLQGSKLTKGISDCLDSDDDWIFRKHFGRADYHKLLGMSP